MAIKVYEIRLNLKKQKFPFGEFPISRITFNRILQRLKFISKSRGTQQVD